MANCASKHAAPGSATGYLYQCRYALLAALRQIPKRPHLSVSIERFDDVAFDAQGTPEEIIQTKHHQPNAGNLTDRSVDLWKTLGIWSNLVLRDSQLPFRTQFLLLTTGKAPKGSAASFLRASPDRDVATAASALLDAAHGSTSDETKSSRQSFINLSDLERVALLESIVILDSAPNIGDIAEDLRAEIYHAAPKEHLDHLIQRLEGWWFSVVAEGLMNGHCSIPLTQVEDKVQEIREGLMRDTLPIDCQDMMVPAEIMDDLDARTFVQQLRLIEVGATRISYAIRDFYRAFEQRSRWVREQLLFDPEIGRYELALQEAWQPLFAEARDKLGSDAPREKMIQSGQDIFRWAERDADVPLRTIRHRFLCHGSYHMLADALKVGWHPDYDDILRNRPMSRCLPQEPRNAGVAATAR
jgi:hypothetical protein